MNKGIKKATGDYLLMLNAGDVLCNKNVLGKVFNENQYYEDIVYGDVLRESNGKVFTESIFPEHLTFHFLRDGAISHQAAFIKRTLHEIVGLYDEALELCSDWSFILLAVCKYKATYRHLSYKISICNTDGLTCSPANAFKIRNERTYVLDSYFFDSSDDVSIYNSNYQARHTIRNKFSVQFLTKRQLKSTGFYSFYQYTSFFISDIYGSIMKTFKGKGV
jgi:hypothetical protein